MRNFRVYLRSLKIVGSTRKKKQIKGSNKFDILLHCLEQRKLFKRNPQILGGILGFLGDSWKYLTHYSVKYVVEAKSNGVQLLGSSSSWLLNDGDGHAPQRCEIECEIKQLYLFLFKKKKKKKKKKKEAATLIANFDCRHFQCHQSTDEWTSKLRLWRVIASAAKSWWPTKAAKEYENYSDLISVAMMKKNPSRTCYHVQDR